MPASRETSTTDRNGNVINYSYDNANRQTGQTWIVSGSTVNLLTFTYDKAANQLSAANYAGTYTMTYDALNRMATEQEPFGQALTFTHDAVGNRTVVQDSQGGVTTSIYDAVNLLTSRQFGGSGQTPLRVDLTYTPRNQIATITRFSNLAGTVTVAYSAYTYDNDQRLTNIDDTNSSGGVLANFTYTYDLASRMTSQTVNGSTTSYSYDAASELTAGGSTNYSYDLNGNRTMTGYTTGADNQITSDGTWTYSYDNNGNLIKKTKGSNAETWTYGYDNQNRMIWAKDSATDGGTVTTLATYVYDALGNRIEEDVWTQSSGSTTVTRFAYDGQNVWADLTSSNTLQTRYLRGDQVDQLFARISSAGTAAWYLTDWQGSVMNLTDNSGNVQDTISYDAFGNVTSESNPSFGDRYKFTGRELDAATGLQYNRARYYNAAIGRWTSQDPRGFQAGDANLYRYVHNSPLLYMDPAGTNRMGAIGGGTYGAAMGVITAAVCWSAGAALGTLATTASLAAVGAFMATPVGWAFIGSVAVSAIASAVAGGIVGASLGANQNDPLDGAMAAQGGLWWNNGPGVLTACGIGSFCIGMYGTLSSFFGGQAVGNMLTWVTISNPNYTPPPPPKPTPPPSA
jgi:RHS repeat-associated protein